MATLGAELGCERYLASTVVTGSGQRSSTLLAELCLSTVLVLALLAFHCRPRRKKRARCTATVTSRMVDASGDKTQLDRVFTDAEDDRDRRGRSFRCKRSKVAGWRGDDGHAPAHEVSHERRKAIEFTLQPAVLHRYVLALEVAGFVEAFTECRSKAGIGRSGGDEADSRGLLGGHHQGPSRHAKD